MPSAAWFRRASAAPSRAPMRKGARHRLVSAVSPSPPAAPAISCATRPACCQSPSAMAASSARRQFLGGAEIGLQNVDQRLEAQRFFQIGKGFGVDGRAAASSVLAVGALDAAAFHDRGDRRIERACGGGPAQHAVGAVGLALVRSRQARGWACAARARRPAHRPSLGVRDDKGEPPRADSRRGFSQALGEGDAVAERRQHVIERGRLVASSKTQARMDSPPGGGHVLG